MSPEPLDDIDRAAIAEQAQRTVERTALRKIRKGLDEIDMSQKQRSQALRIALIACAVLVALGAWLLWSIIGTGVPKSPPVDVKALRPNLERKQ